MIVIKPLSKEHIEELVKIEEDSFTTPWSEQAFVDELSNKLAYYLVAQDKDEVVGYIGLWIIVDEAHITNIAVKHTKRRQGIGKQLLEEAIQLAIDKKCRAMTLEVRQSNEKAINLYKNYQFNEAAIRKGYYTNPKEDALIMWKNL